VVKALQQQGDMPRLILRTDTIQGLLDLLVSGEVDAVVGGLDGEWVPKNMHQLDVVTLWQLSLAVVAAKDHPLTRCPSVSWAQTLDHEWVLMPHGSSSRRTVERSFLAAGLAPPPACIETASFHIGLALAANTRLLAVVPHEAYEKNRSHVSRLRMNDPFPASAIVWVTLHGVPTLPAVKTLANAFAAYAGQLVT
jgi:DNA-binding transcriptional LysR family regulator